MVTPARTPGKLGRLPNDPSKDRLALGPRLDTTVPPSPAVVDWLSKVASWPVFLNDRLGDCTCAMLGHAVEAYTAYGRGVTATVTDQDVLKVYEKVSGYNPSDPSTDQGAVIQDVLNYWRTTGIGGHKILAFAQVDHTNPAEVKAAVNVFGALLVGIRFPAVAMDQFNQHQPWDAVHNDGGIEGGHAIHVGHDDTSSVRYQVTTWGAVQGMTQAFWDKYVDECWVAISPEWLDAAGHSPGGLDLYGLGEDLAALTGGPNPFPSPSPSPTPEPPAPAVDPADRALAATLGSWLSEHHTGDNRRAATAVRTWMAAKGL